MDIFVAAETGNQKELQKAIDEGMNVNIQNEEGFTPLHSAAFNEQTEMIKILLTANVSTISNLDGVICRIGQIA